jgi:hypothetical protein
MNSAYTTTVRQLLDIAPVVFTNHRLEREAALETIAGELSAISQKLEAMGYEVRQRRNSASNETG